MLKSGWLRSFVSTEARILQQPHLLSSDFFNKINYLNQNRLQAARQREANSTVFKYVVNPLPEIIFD
ncbi:hypothetical protein AOA59_25310 [Pseudomonas sp. 2822-15]|nr:hypothetical protein AOA59_25310 [Pseudomonas sp. 2822-15]